MRLEYLFDWENAYEGDGATVRVDAGARLWGRGTGRVTGPRLSGDLHWCNHAHRNAGGVWHPDVHGFIATDDGARILVDGEGYSVPNADDTERVMTVALRFHTDDDRYAWLNTAIVVLDGTFVPSALASSRTVGYLLER